MRVVVVADFAEPSGGAQAVAILSAIALARTGLRVTFIQGVSGPVDPRLAEARVEVASLGLTDVWCLPSAQAALAGIWNRDASRRLTAALASLPPGPTVLHVHLWTRSLSPSVFPALLASGRPLALTLHDYFSACPNGVYYRFEREAPCNLRPLSPACLRAPCDPRSMAHKAVRVLRTAALRAVIGKARFDVIHVSDRGRDTIAPFLPPGLRQHRLDNPVDAGEGAPAEIGRGARLAYLGRFTREKGADLVAAAAEAAGTEVVFVGEGPAEGEIRALAPGRGRILGWRARAEIERMLRAEVRAVVAPSRWYETGPLTVYEAMAAGVPAVVSSRAGAAEKVRDGLDGLVVEPEVAALAAAFRRLSDDGEARRMGRAAFASYWSSPLSPEAHARGLTALYSEMLARPA